MHTHALRTREYASLALKGSREKIHPNQQLRGCLVDAEKLKSDLEGCYVTIPTPFLDQDGFPINESALRKHIRFLLNAGLNGKYATFLVAGAAGDFSTMTFEERVRVTRIAVDEIGGACAGSYGRPDYQHSRAPQTGSRSKGRGAPDSFKFRALIISRTRKRTSKNS